MSRPLPGPAVDRPHLDQLPAAVRCVIEVPAGGRVKRGPAGEVEYISPLACPFNYGSAPDHPAADGDPADVVVLGARRERGEAVSLPVVGRVCFTDGGVVDDKWICAERPPDDAERRMIEKFFLRYATIKRVADRARRQGGASRFEGIELRVPLRDER